MNTDLNMSHTDEKSHCIAVTACCLETVKSVCLFVCLSVCLSVCLTACLPACLSACLVNVGLSVKDRCGVT